MCSKVKTIFGFSWNILYMIGHIIWWNIVLSQRLPLSLRKRCFLTKWSIKVAIKYRIFHSHIGNYAYLVISTAWCSSSGVNHGHWSDQTPYNILQVITKEYIDSYIHIRIYFHYFIYSRNNKIKLPHSFHRIFTYDRPKMTSLFGVCCSSIYEGYWSHGKFVSTFLLNGTRKVYAIDFSVDY